MVSLIWPIESLLCRLEFPVLFSIKQGGGTVRMALEWISGGTVAVEFASKSLNSLYFSLLQGIWQRMVRSGLDPPP